MKRDIKKKKRLPEGYRPSLKDVEWFLNYWKGEERYFAPVNVMFKLCLETYPKNDNFEEVLLKCATIDAFSSTNVYDLQSMARHIVELNIDDRLKNGDLSLVQDIGEIEFSGKKRILYSFATKYCHYHNPEIFAIYDRYVDKVLCAFLNDFSNYKANQLRDYKVFTNVLHDFRHHYGLENLSLDDLDKYLWQLGKWYFNQFGPIYKYYNREDKSPFDNNDVRDMFWNGEMMFATRHQKVGYWKEKGKEWLKTANDLVRQLANRCTPEQFGVVTYMSCLEGKWLPYDDLSWFSEY